MEIGNNRDSRRRLKARRRLIEVAESAFLRSQATAIPRSREK